MHLRINGAKDLANWNGETLCIGDQEPICPLAKQGRAGLSNGVLGLEMFDIDIDPAPLFAEVFGDEATVTVVGLVLAA